MSKGIYKPNFSELLKDLQSISEIQERIDDVSLVRLKELIIHLDSMLLDKLRSIDGLISANHKSDNTNYIDFEFWKENLSQYGFNYNDLKSLKELISKRINYLTEKQKNHYKDLVFKDLPSQRFFTYLIDNWLKEEINKVTALRYIFSSMYFRNEDDCPFKITCTQTYFAREFWNKYYKDILEINPKNPKLNQDSFTDYYHKRFKNLLTEFQGG